MPFAFCLLPIRLSPIAFCLLPFAYCIFHGSGRESGHCCRCWSKCYACAAGIQQPPAHEGVSIRLLPFAYCLSPIAFCLLPFAYCILHGSRRGSGHCCRCWSKCFAFAAGTQKPPAHDGGAIRLLPIVYSPNAYSPNAYCLLPNALLPIAFLLGSWRAIEHCSLRSADQKGQALWMEGGAVPSAPRLRSP